MRTTVARALAIALAATAIGTPPLSAQVDPAEEKHRADCRLAAQILDLGQPAVKWAWALDVIGSCPGASDVLRALWASPPDDDAGLQGLYHASIQAADPEVFDVALAVAQDPAAPAPVRLAALGSVVTYLRPDLVLYLEARSRLDGFEPLEWSDVWGTLDHPVHTSGEVALPSGAGQAVLDLLTGLRADEGIPPLLHDAAYWLVTLHGVEGRGEAAR